MLILYKYKILEDSMNKLVIVGNGFDLAHGLKTSYKSFIDYIWSNLIKHYNDLLFNGLVEINKTSISLFQQPCLNYKEFRENTLRNFENKYTNIGKYIIQYSEYGDKTFQIFFKSQTSNKNNIKVFMFKNRFFEYITVQNIENWVDIENSYYKMLISIANNKEAANNTYFIEQLNEEFKQIKDLLEYYLINEVDSKIKESALNIEKNSIVNLFAYQFKGLNVDEADEYFLEFSPDSHESLIDFDKQFEKISYGSINRKYEYLFLDFNYTSNIQNYVSVLNQERSQKFGFAKHIQIHGNLYDQNNKINFGFGDEMDDNYKFLENLGDNKYLENIKSFLYLHNSNYRKMLNWIEKESFQVYVLGHSCGLSDRTLLNTIFENENCKSIKVYYYKDVDNDNFKDLTQNISRHFDNKKLMRKKLVDKSLCSELPQDVKY